jgi:MFS family permease
VSDDRQFYPLYLTRFVGSLGFVTLVTLLPTYIETLGAEGVVVGLFITALGVGRTLAVVPLGWAADRYDKRTILLASMAVGTVAYAGFGVIETSIGFLAARTLQGLSAVGTGMVALALVGDMAPPDERANRIGVFNSWRMAAGIVGTLGAGAMAETVGLDPIFGGIVGLLVVATVGVWYYVEPDDSSEGFAFLDLAMNDRIVTVTTFRAQYAVAVTLVRSWVPILVGVSAAQGGLGLGALAVGVAVAAEKFANGLCQPFTGRLSDGHGRALFVAAGGGAYGLVALGIPFAADVGASLAVPTALPVLGTVPAAFLVVVGLNALLGVADAFREPASMALFADEGSGEGIASSFGVRGLVWRPGALLAPLLGGYLMEAFGVGSVFLAGGAAAISGALVFSAVLVARYDRGAFARW